MAFISKMQIRGIRSFSPDRDETIEFYAPLTMIVGANGCGKTTIIESLNFACSGALPPNVKSGQSFINDPAMTDSSESKAQIKLRFQNRRGFVCVAVRSMQVARKKNKLEYKALDSVLRTTQENGEKVSLSMKCSELDRQIPDHLGVSAAIMENVIFVHQEESDWPMLDGASVKKRFDEIFDSTRYSRALEAITKAKKEKASSAKDLKGEVMELSAHLRTTKDSRRELEDCVASQELCTQQLDSVTEKLTRNKERMESCSEILRKFQETQQEITSMQIRIQESKRRIDEKTKSLDQVYDPMTTTDQDLLERLSNFDAQTTAKMKDLQTLKRATDFINSEISKKRTVLESLNLKKGQASSMKEQLDQAVSNQQALVRVLADKYAIPKPRYDSNRPEYIEAFLQSLNEKKSQHASDSETKLQALRKEVANVEASYMELKSSHQRKEIALQNAKTEIDRLKVDINSKRQELQSLSSARNDLVEADRDYEEYKKHVEQMKTTLATNSATLKQRTKENGEQIRELEEEIVSDDRMLQELNANRIETNRFEEARKRLEDDETQIKYDLEQLYDMHSDTFKSLDIFSCPILTPSSSNPSLSLDPSLAVSDMDQVIATINTAATEARTAYNISNNDLINISKSLLTNETLQHQEERILQELQTRVTNLGSIDDKLATKLEIMTAFNTAAKAMGVDNLPFDESNNNSWKETTMDDVASGADSFLSLIISVIASGKLIKSFNKNMAKMLLGRPGTCPCCEQKLGGGGVEVVQRNLNEIFDVMHSRIVERVGLDRTKEILMDMKLQEERIRGLQVELKEHDGLLREVRDCVSKVGDYRGKVVELMGVEGRVGEEVRVRKERCNVLERVVRELGDIGTRWSGVDRKMGDLKRRRGQASSSLSSVSSYSYGDGSGAGVQYRSIDELEQALRAKRERRDELLKVKDKVFMDLNDCNQRQLASNNALLVRERDLSDLKARGMRHGELDGQVRVGRDRLGQLEELSRTLGREVEEGVRITSECSRQLNVCRTDCRNAEEIARGYGGQIGEDVASVVRARDQVCGLEARCAGKEYSVEGIEAGIGEVTQEIISQEEVVKTNIPKINSLSAEVNSQERFKRLVQDNIDLRAARVDHQGLVARMQVLEVRMVSGAGVGAGVGSSVGETQREMQRAEQERQRYMTERDTARGKLEIYNQQAISIKEKLVSVTYRNIDERHRKKTIEYETTEMAVKDLDSYAAALDSALQNFHIQKIKEINKIIRELWQVIYKGQDIDMIEVESGPEAGAAGAGTTGTGTGKTTSRSYNYRVVMRKGDLPLDMRGRCSAGQRVLASIVIRLALAETFCLNCGILALDEPTTNLDDPNKAGLAHALARIIQSRSRQQNFQLICITHDEDFVRLMNNELSTSADVRKPEYYFRISRQEEGNSGKFFSQIERIPWDEM